MRVPNGLVGAVLWAALVMSGCSNASAAGVDAASPAEQMCPPGEVVGGIHADGTLACVEQAGVRQQTCGLGMVMAGIRADGTIVCVEAGASLGSACEEGQVMTGFDEDGEPLCVSTAELVRDYVNAHCYVYFGWRDSCNDCTTLPAKAGRVRGDGIDCATFGSNSNCATFELFGQPVRMAGINTDGDVDNNDKFWIGLRCE